MGSEMDPRSEVVGWKSLLLLISPITILTWMFLKHYCVHQSHMLKKDVHEEISYIIR